MNANELADEYTENNPSCWDGYELHEWARKAATMLRQQQVEILMFKNLLLDNQILLDKTLNAWAKEMERKK